MGEIEVKHSNGIITVFLNGNQVMEDYFICDKSESFKSLFRNLGFDVKDCQKEEDETVEIPYSWIKLNMGWYQFCLVTGYNEYMISEWGEPDLRTTYTVTKNQAKELCYIL